MDGAGVENVADFAVADIRAIKGESNNLELFGINDRRDGAGDGGAKVKAEDWTVDDSGNID